MWEVDYRPHAETRVTRGENSGRVLDHLNSVTAVKRLGSWHGDASRYAVSPPVNGKDKVAILVQAPDFGPIIGAAVQSP